MDIRDVEYRGSSLTASGRPREWFPQVAVAGRSNVGKSSLLNWLFRRSLARVAKAPGKTRTLNFYLVNGAYFLVDLPGYGYAKVAKALRAQWGLELERYLVGEPRLAGVIALMDIRHGPTALDLELVELLDTAGRDRAVVLTKADKVGRGPGTRMRHDVQRRLGLATLPLAVSVRNDQGRQDLLRRIDEMVSGWRQPPRGD